MSSQLIPIKDQTALVLEDGRVYKIQHRRQRKILSCVACHRRKIKCTRETPKCSICIKRNIECHYFLNDRVSRGGRPPSKSGHTYAADTGGPHDSNIQDPIEKKRHLLMAIEKAKTLVNDNKTPLGLQVGQDSRIETATQRDTETTFPSVPSSSFAPLDNSQTSAQLKPYSIPAFSGPTMSPPLYFAPSQPSPLLSFGKDLQGYLPSAERAHELFEIFRTVVHPIIPLLDIPKFIQDQELFWIQKFQGETNQTNFLVILFPVLYAASKAQFHQCDGNDAYFQEMSRYLEATNVLYALHDFPNTFNIKMVTGSVLINSVIENPSITAIGQLSRLAQRTLLTRDPALYHQITDERTIQCRRILFWQIFQLDTMTSLYNNLPPLIKADDFDTASPEEVIQGELEPALLLLNAKQRFILLLNELCASTDRGTFQGLKERIVDLHTCCMDRALLLSNHSRRIRPLSQHEGKFIEWAVFMLNTFADRSLLLLHLNIIKTSLPMLMKRRQIMTQANDDKSGKTYNPIAESGYGKNFLTIQAILNDSGNLPLDHKETPDGLINASLVYNYEDLTNNLIPASLHYLDEFLKYHTDSTFSCFNWELMVGNMPINAITFTIKTLALDLNRAHRMSKLFALQNDLRYVILSQAIPVAEMKVDAKTAVCKNCFQLIKLLFRLIIVKHRVSVRALSGTQMSASQLFHSKYDIGTFPLSTPEAGVIPRPNIGSTGGPSGTSDISSPPINPTSDVGSGSDRLLRITNIINGEDIFNDGFTFSGNLIYNNDASNSSNVSLCAQIAPRTMRALASSPPPQHPMLSIFGEYGIPGQQPNNLEQGVPLNTCFENTYEYGNITSSAQPSAAAAAPRSTPSIEPSLPHYKPLVGTSSDYTSVVTSLGDFQIELDCIRKEVEQYIILLNRDRGDLEGIGSGDDYYREFENALLEIICGILAV
ncbi:LADA_0G03730g1_1 [Lachancea dasiensis]|uniref:LADA_0G03730g1_1 n=1 Tax=Lachancea dasiensis TaxID=1072105 RepID=A0A1G4JS87_9SACH|nr:LADA_0G03730g1_1 [Lachancea dasiensis]